MRLPLEDRGAAGGNANSLPLTHALATLPPLLLSGLHPQAGVLTFAEGSLPLIRKPKISLREYLLGGSLLQPLAATRDIFLSGVAVEK